MCIHTSSGFQRQPYHLLLSFFSTRLRPLLSMVSLSLPHYLISLIHLYTYNTHTNLHAGTHAPCCTLLLFLIAGSPDNRHHFFTSIARPTLLSSSLFRHHIGGGFSPFPNTHSNRDTHPVTHPYFPTFSMLEPPATTTETPRPVAKPHIQ